MKLVSIPKDKYDEYRLDVIFDCYKWDPQFLDNNTIARHVLVITAEEHKELEQLTEKIDKETIQAEEMLNNNFKLAKPLALPKKIYKELKNMKNYDSSKHVRLMRYDFHPTVEGKWAVSEVNSDVPGGFAEASLMPQAAIKILERESNEKSVKANDGNLEMHEDKISDENTRVHEDKISDENTRVHEDKISDESIKMHDGKSSQKEIKNNKYWHKNFGDILANAISKKVVNRGTIMLVHCTSYSDDRQVMQFLGDKLKSMEFNVIYAAADHLNFENNEAISVLDGNEGKVDAIFRFTPLEWLIDIKPKRWQGYFDTITTSCNHPIAIFAQTKRFPLVWDSLEQAGVNLSTWRELLPETLEVKDAKNKEGYIFKPACGRVGEKISIKEACRDDEFKEIIKDVKKHPKKYLAQKRFNSKPLISDEGESFHVCLGSYTVDGKHAGYYARISGTPRIDSNAADIPVLIERS